LVSTTSHHGREKSRNEDIPKLSAYSGSLVPHLSHGTIRLSKIRPPNLTVDSPLRIAMMASTSYLLAYVHEIARKDVERARLISELIEVPLVKQLEGTTKYVVEKRHLSDIILQEYSRVGEEAGEDLAKRVIYTKPEERSTTHPATAPSPI